MMNQNLIIIGSAPCLADDITALIDLLMSYRMIRMGAEMSGTFDYMAIGLDAADIISVPIRHVATYHNYELPAFRERRIKSGLNIDYLAHSHEAFRSTSTPIDGRTWPDLKPDGSPWVDRIWPYQKPSGSSALLGIQAGLGMGYEKIIVTGCPLSGRYEEFHKGWIVQLDTIKDTVRSMSGWTRDLLGAPTKEWMNE